MTDLLIHRGIVNKNYNENLLKSFKQSFKKGYGIETDIHATKDNKFICFHDFTLNRIFRKNVSVKNLNYSKIKEISSKNKKTIPLLKDLLKTSKNKYPLFIELKPTFSKRLFFSYPSIHNNACILHLKSPCNWIMVSRKVSIPRFLGAPVIFC